MLFSFFLVGNLPSPYALTTRLLVSGLQAERTHFPWGHVQEGAHPHGEGKELVPCKEAGGCCGERCPDPRPIGFGAALSPGCDISGSPWTAQPRSRACCSASHAALTGLWRTPQPLEE